MPQAKENQNVLAQIISNTEVSHWGVKLPEFVLTIEKKKSITWKERLLLNFTKAWIGKDNFNPDEARREDKILVATSYLFEVLDEDKLEVFLIDIDWDTPANSLSWKLYFKDEETGEPTANCAAWNGILNFIKVTTRNFREA